MEQGRTASLASGYYTDRNISLRHVSGLSERELAALQSLQMRQRLVMRDAVIHREGDSHDRLMVVSEGWAVRYTMMPDGRRQILSFILPGDLINLHFELGRASKHGIASLTPCKIIEIDGTEIQHALRTLPNLVESLNWYVSRELTILGDQTLRLGRMTAFERVCHLLLELWYRQKYAGEIDGNGTVNFPITQAIIADTLGLSVVHVNRQVMKLRREGWVTIQRRKLTITAEEQMRRASGFLPEHFEPPTSES